MISLVLSHNLQRAGNEVVTFHPFLSKMQPLFPHLPLAPFPSKEECLKFDQIFIFYEKSPEMKEILDFCEEKMKEKTLVLNPIATFKNDYPYWENGKFDGRLPFAENLKRFCEQELGVKDPVLANGITLREGLVRARYPKRVAIHPSSSKPDKNWTLDKFLVIARQLKQRGYEPYFVLTDRERQNWPLEKENIACADDLVALAEWMYESGLMIGNDSGIGHLASCLGLPTVTICRNRATSYFWRPAWTQGSVITPPAWIPNLKGLRLRDWYWQKWIPSVTVLSSVLRISPQESGAS